jgi:hypothetical protein
MLLTLSDQKVLELYYQNPEFGIFIVRMIIQRFIHQIRVGRVKALIPPERFE